MRSGLNLSVLHGPAICCHLGLEFEYIYVQWISNQWWSNSIAGGTGKLTLLINNLDDPYFLLPGAHFTYMV